MLGVEKKQDGASDGGIFPIPRDTVAGVLKIEPHQITSLEFIVSKKNKDLGWVTIRATPAKMQSIFRRPNKKFGTWNTYWWPHVPKNMLNRAIISFFSQPADTNLARQTVRSMAIVDLLE